MSLKVQTGQVQDIATKWELAQRISGHAKAPEQALKSVFTAAMQQLEVIARTKFETPMRDRVWDRVSGDKLKALKEEFILEFCDKILGGFDEEAATAMLAEHKRTGDVKNLRYSTQLQVAFQLSQSSIIDAIVQKANSMTDSWIPEIVNAARSEGIELPEPKGKTTAMHSHPATSPSVVEESAISAKPKISPFEMLTNAVETGDLDSVREALQNGADPNGRVGVSTMIHLACEKGNVGIVQELLDNGARLNSTNSKFSDTPLHRACVFGRTEVVAELIKRGAKVNVRSDNCWMTPLEDAITFKHFDCCKLLIQAGAKVNEVNRNYGSTPLTEACHKGSYEIVELLLDSGADPNVSATMTPLYQAVHSPAILQLMIDRIAKPNIPNAPGSHYQASQQPIHAAASWGYDDSVRILLKAGADPKARDGQNKTPFEIARWQLNNHRTNPCNPPEVTAQMIQRLEKVIGLLEV